MPQQNGPQQVRIVGLDVSKAKLDACIVALGLHATWPSTPAGRVGLIGWLRQNDVGLAVMEASGGYERAWAATLREAGIAVRVVDPKRVRYFAKALGKLAKSDPVDAEMIARYGTVAFPAGEPTHDPQREELDQLVGARSFLVKLATGLAHRGEHAQPRVVEQAHQAVIKTIKAQLVRIERVIERKIDRHAPFAARREIIRSVPGLGPQLAAGMLAWLPELGTIGNKAACALIGVAPYDDDSGQHQGQRHIRGGRREIRDLLYMPAMGAATRHNPVIAAYYQRLRGKGKPAKVALVACMRKLIVILNTMMARGEKWNPPKPCSAQAETVAPAAPPVA